MQNPPEPETAARDLEARADQLLEQGHAREALEVLQRALHFAPELGRLHAKRGSAFMMLGDPGGAVTAYEKARATLPNSAALLTNLGAALAATKQMDAAFVALRRAVELRPNYSIGLYNLGRALAQAGDLQGAAEAFNSAVIADPASVPALIGLGQAHADLKQLEAAADCFGRALRIDPASAEALLNLGHLAQQANDLRTAAAYLEQAAASDPGQYGIATNLATIYAKLGRPADSRRESQRAMHLHPTSAVVRSNFLFCLDFDPDLSRQEIFAAHREFEAFMPSAPPRQPHSRRPADKIRVGYVSGDFRTHACAYFMLPLLRAHDASTVEVFCYSNTEIEDSTTEAFKAVAHWRPIRDLDDAGAAALIASDGIDILVDCAGHSRDNRLGVFAQRPASHAVTWLGYPNTTGLRAIDYRFTDDVLDPLAEANAWATEKLIRLPHGFVTFDPLRPLPALAPLPVTKNGHVTFGSFNGLGKINRNIVDIWCRVLRAVENSRLVLKDQHFDHADIRSAVMDMVLVHGIAPERCTFLGYTADPAAHLTSMSDVDVCLDTHPYSGNTTTCDLLLMGVPVVTLYGDRCAARQSASILTQLNLGHLVARDGDAFVRAAVSLAGNMSGLTDLRRRLRQTFAATAVGDPRIFAASVEAAYRQIVQGQI